MTDSQEANIVKNVYREIEQQCFLKNIAVNDSLAAFIVKAVVLHPANNFNVEQAINKSEIERLIKICVEKLSDDSLPSLDTIKMQICFDENYIDRETFEKEQMNLMRCKVEKLMKGILEAKELSCKDQECLFHKIVAYIIIRSGLGSSHNDEVIRETAAALKSIYPVSNLDHFMNLSKPKKEKQLVELTMVTSGIRVFNKESKKGGGNLENIPKMLNDIISTMFSDISIKLNLTENDLDLILNILEFFRETVRDLPSELEEKLKQSVINCCQYLLFLKVVKKDLARSAQRIEENVSRLSNRIDHLHLTVSNKSAVPNSQILPQFANLAEIWMDLQVEKNHLVLLTNLLTSLEGFVKVRKRLMESDEVKESILHVKNEDMIKRKVSNIVTGKKDGTTRIQPTTKPFLKVLYPESTSNFNRLLIQFGGYCCWTLVMRDRLLVQGNPKLGVVCYKNLCYSFTSSKAADDFMNDPDWYLNAVGVQAKLSLELVQLLQLYNQFSSLEPFQQRDPEELVAIEKPLLKSDCGSQTETHVKETNIARSYEWNEWQMRRMAIRLANLRNKQTTSSQTNMSSMRMDISTQAYKTKSTETQTKTDARSNVPRPQVFLAGLRGTNPTQYLKVDLTLDENN